jgi:hypothetical protein
MSRRVDAADSADATGGRTVIVSAVDPDGRIVYHTTECQGVRQIPETETTTEVAARAEGLRKCGHCDANDSGRVKCCPNCDRRTFTVRGGGMEENDVRSDTQYYCRACGHDFDIPATKEGERQPPQHGPATTLMNADPDEYPK